MNLKEFVEWAKKQGSVANPQKGTFKGQCVSLIQQYLYQVFGKPFKAYGNAKDWINNYPRGYFNKLSNTIKLQAGDVLVYNKNYGNGFGHVAMIDHNGRYFEQNGLKKLAVGHRDYIKKGYTCVLRPTHQNKLFANSQKSTYSFKVGKVYTTQVDLKVRAEAGTNQRWKLKSELSVDGQKNATNSKNAVLKKGTKVTCKAIRAIGKDTWIQIPSGWIAGNYNGKLYLK